MDPGYGEPAGWASCRRAAGALMLWWDHRHRGEDAAAVSDPPAQTLDAYWVLALALWRAMTEHGVDVDDLALSAPLAWLPRHAADAAALWAEPLPAPRRTYGDSTSGDPASGERHWARIRRRGDAPLVLARQILAAHHQDAADRWRLLGDTPDLIEAPAVIRIGWRLRDLASQVPVRRVHAEHLADRARELATQVRTGAWRPDAAEQAAAALLLPALTADPDYPPVPGLTGRPSWLQRLTWLTGVAATARTVLISTGLGDVAGLGQLLAGIARSRHDHADVPDVLDAAWAARPARQSLAAWECEQVPLGLREEIVALEDALGGVGELLAAIATGDGAP